jgi:hypothetical protein
MSVKCQTATSLDHIAQTKSRPQAASQFNLPNLDQVAKNAGFDFRR